jgi:hypothetical protein
VLPCSQHIIHKNPVQQSMQGWLRGGSLLHSAGHTGTLSTQPPSVVPIITLPGISLSGFASRNAVEWFHISTAKLCYQNEFFPLPQGAITLEYSFPPLLSYKTCSCREKMLWQSARRSGMMARMDAPPFGWQATGAGGDLPEEWQVLIASQASMLTALLSRMQTTVETLRQR